MYKIIATISVLIRQFVLPNPFKSFGLIGSIVANLIAEPIVHILAFGLVGIFYARGTAPALGSFLYLICYAVITGTLYLMAMFAFSLSSIIFILLIVYVATIILNFVF